VSEHARLARLERRTGYLTKRRLILLARGSELSATATVSIRNLLAAGAMDEPILISYGSERELFPTPKRSTGKS
jgi:hypothetical protein